ncbi:MAG: hypothetical protein HKN79_07020, partial [Flavobacteriales bacterium]|nr:hypothetical protein [Flavobacteriales bacterium]
TYQPGVNDSINGGVTITLTADGESVCPVIETSVFVEIIGLPEVIADASSSTDICSDGQVVLNGNQENTSSTNWQTSGDGTFSNTGEDPTYFPGPNDITSGSATLTYTGIPLSNVCPVTSESLSLTITEAPSAGSDNSLSICESASEIDLQNYLSADADGGGTFVDQDGSGALNGTVFNPSLSGPGVFSIVYQVSGTPPCDDDESTITVEVTTGTESGVGTSLSLCESEAPIDLFSQLTGNPQSDGTWTSEPTTSALLDGTFDPNSSGPGDFLINYITSLEGCQSDTAFVSLTIGAEPNVSTSESMITICETQQVLLNGSADQTDSLLWTSNGSGVFTDPDSGNTIYTTSDDDIQAGTVDLILNGYGDPSCPVTTTSVSVTIATGAEAGADNAATLCSSSPALDLNNLLDSDADSGGAWTDVDGSGALTGSEFDPSMVADGTYLFEYEVSASDACPTDVSTMEITVTSAANAGDDTSFSLCESTGVIELLDYIPTNAQSAGTWSAITTSDGLDGNTLDIQELGPGTYEYSYQVEIADCNSLDESSMTLIVESAPSIVFLDFDPVICENSEYTTQTQASDYATLTWTSSGDGAFTDENALEPDYSPGPADIASGEVMLYLQALSSNSCPLTMDSLQLGIVAAPTADAGEEAIETCGSQSVNLDGSAENATSIQWTTTDGDGTFDDPNSEDPVYTPGPTDLLSGNTTLEITVDGNPVCPSASDQLLLTVSTPAEAGEDNSYAVCVTGQAFELTPLLSSEAQSGGQWEDTDSSGALVGSAFDPGLTEIGSYTVTYAIDGEGSCGMDYSEVIIEVSEGPNAGEDGAISLCASSNSIDLIEYISGGADVDGNWTDLSSSGALNGGIFDPSASGIGSFEIEYEVEWEGCGTDKSLLTIDVTPAPSVSIENQDLDICSGENFTLYAEAQHSTSLQWTTSGSGTFGSPDTDITEYGPSSEDIDNGSVVLTIIAEGSQGCEASESSITLIIHPSPIAYAGEDQGVCGLSTTLLAQPSAGLGQWESVGGLSFADPTDAGTTVSASDYGSYTLTWTEDNTGCTDQDQVTIEFWDAPDTLSTQATCINTNTQYQISFDIQGGDMESYSVLGDGTLNGTLFTSDPISTGEDYSFILNDIHDCAPLVISGAFSCPSLSDAGSLSSDTLHACIGDAIQVVIENEAFLDADDTQQYILHDAPNGIGTLLAISNSGLFVYEENIQPDVIYYVNSVVGNADDNGDVDLSHPDVSISNSTPLIFHSLPILEVTSNSPEICMGEVASIDFTMMGSGPFEVGYSYTGQNSSTVYSSSEGSVEIDEEGIFTFEQLSDNYCAVELSVEVPIIVHELPTAVFLPENISQCENEIEEFPVLLTGDGPWTFDWSIDGVLQETITTVDPEYPLTPSISGWYHIQGLEDAHCPTSIGDSVDVQILPAPAVALGPDISICSGDTVEIGILPEGDAAYSWSNAAFLADAGQSMTTAFPGNEGTVPVQETFILTATWGICSTQDELVVNIDPAPTDFGINGPLNICLGDELELQAYGGVSYDWHPHPSLYNVNTSTANAQPVEETVYTVTVFNSYQCTAESSVEIDVFPVPEP